MSPVSQTSKAFLIFIAFSLTITSVAAEAQVDIDKDDQVMWRQSPDKTLNFGAQCTNATVQEVDLRFEPLDNEIKEWSTSSDWTNLSYKFDDSNPTGDYVIEAACDNGENTTEMLKIDDMKVNFQGVREGDEWYVGVRENVSMSFSSDESSFRSGKLSYIRIALDGDDVVTKTDGFSRSMRLGITGDDLKEVVPEDRDSSNVKITVEAFYGDNNPFKIDVAEKDITLNKWRVFNVDVRPDTRLTSNEFSNLNLAANIWYEGVPMNRVNDSFGPDNFYLAGYPEDKDGSKWFEGELIDEDTGRYYLELGPTPQSLQRRMEVVFDSERSADGEVEVADVTIEDIEKYVWNAKVLTPDQDAVEADFRIDYGDRSYINFTSTNGDFSRKIWPGDHNMEVTFPTSKLSMSDVTLKEDNSGRNIIYNYIYYNNIGDVLGSETLEGIKPVNLASYSFAYPMSGGSVDMRFNNEQIDSSEAVKVYECTQWHFGDKECRANGGWQEIEDIRTVPASWKSTKYSTAEFSVEPHQSEDNGKILQNAYIVGTSADLLLNGGLRIKGAGTDGRVETGGDITIAQTLISENENPVEGAEVEVSFYRGSTRIDTLGTVETGPEGTFSAKGEAPSEPGNYSIRIEAESENYNDLDTEFDDQLEVFIAEGIGVEAESPLEVTLGQDTSTMIDVENTGQTEMKDVKIDVSGMNSDFYTVSRDSFASIESGESRKVELIFSIPESYGVDDYPSLDIEVSAKNDEGEEFTDSDSIQTQLTYGSSQQTGTADSEEPDEEPDSSSFSTDQVAEMTGEFLDSQSSLNIALGLILVFLMALAGAMKQKKNENSDRRRGGGGGGRPSVQRPSLQKQEDEQEAEEEDEDDFDSQIDEIAGAFEEEEPEESDEDIDEIVEETETEEVEEEEEQEEDTEPEEHSTRFVCEVCGEKFDSESGKDLHESVMH